MLTCLKSRGGYLGLCRYIAGLSMIPYAVSKLLKLQFTVLPTHAWQLPLEQLSGPVLVWSFLGHSGWFQVLLGVLELVPALLLFRRTITLMGAILLPLTLNALLVNEAFQLWPETRTIALVLVLLNVGLLAFEWRNIQRILLLILQRERKYQLNNWEKGLNLLLVAVVAGLISNELLGYARETNELTGDWYHQHPNEWAWQPVPVAPPAPAGRRYLGAFGSYEEVGPAGLNKRLRWYKLNR